jgi:DnaK suppressor protein
MNATVAKSAKKSAAAKKAVKKVATPAKKSAAAKKAAPAKSKSAVKSAVKPAAKAVKPKVPAKKTVKSAAKPAASVAKSKAAPAVKAATSKAKAQPVKKTAAAPVKTPAVTVRDTAPPKMQSGKDMSTDKTAKVFVDTMQKSAVSKVSEVAKTSRATQPIMPANGPLLTEEEILRMGDKDYMNGAQLAFFKARLQQLERDLLKNADETTEHLRETVLVPDPADRATIEEEHALELRTRDRERKLLKKVQQSLAAIESGEYGWCEETGEPIGIPRLLARPTATLSLEAQQRRELKQKLYGD